MKRGRSLAPNQGPLVPYDGLFAGTQVDLQSPEEAKGLGIFQVPCWLV